MKARTCPGYKCAAGGYSQGFKNPSQSSLLILALHFTFSSSYKFLLGHTEPFQMHTGDTLRFDFRVLFTGVDPPARFTALRYDFRAELADVRLSAGKKTKFLNRGQEHEWWWKFSLEGSEQRRLALTCLAAPGRCLTFPWIFIIHAATLLCTHHSLGGGGFSRAMFCWMWTKNMWTRCDA